MAARSGRRGGGLLWPADGPPRGLRRDAFELRNAGRVEVFVFVWQRTLWADGLEYYHVFEQRAPSGTGVVQHTVLLLLRSGHYSLIHNFQALASRQGLTLGATPANTGGCREYKCPRCMARFTLKASWQRHRATQCYREIAERTRKVPLPGPEKSLLRYRGKASAELAPLTCYADLEVYSTPAPTVHIAQQQPARQTVAASSCYVAVGPRDGVPRGAPASGARSDIAAAAEPMLGVDCRNQKKERSRALVFSSSRFLAFSIMLISNRRSCSI